MNEIERSSELFRQAWRGEAAGESGWHGHHDLDHAGQIALLRRALESAPEAGA